MKARKFGTDMEHLRFNVKWRTQIAEIGTNICRNCNESRPSKTRWKQHLWCRVCGFATLPDATCKFWTMRSENEQS